MNVEDEKERLIAKSIRDLTDELRLKGHPSFSAAQVSALLERGCAFEPRRIRYIHGARRKCLEIAHKKLLEHDDWSLWIGFILNKNPPSWSAHAWNITPRRCLIEPNARPGEVELYYGAEMLAGSKSLTSRGLSPEEIRKFDTYTHGFATLQRFLEAYKRE